MHVHDDLAVCLDTCAVIRVALYQPEIPPNTGNVIRLCANAGAELHLIRPLGFVLDDARLRRAGLDYHDLATMHVHDDLAAFRQAIPDARWLPFTTRGSQRHDQVTYRDGDVLLFGPETRGLPDAVLAQTAPEDWVYLPQQPAARSLNLSNAVAVAVYEVWRQAGFVGARPAGPAGPAGLAGPAGPDVVTAKS